MSATWSRRGWPRRAGRRDRGRARGVPAPRRSGHARRAAHGAVLRHAGEFRGDRDRAPGSLSGGFRAAGVLKRRTPLNGPARGGGGTPLDGVPVEIPQRNDARRSTVAVQKSELQTLLTETVLLPVFMALNR